MNSVAEARERASGKPLLLDLFSGAGGAARGYQRAGFYVVGVDTKLQPRYAGDEFVQADAMTYPLEGFDAIHASPPCQHYSIMRNLPWLRDKEYPALIEPIRERLKASGIPWVIENVYGARRSKRRPDGMQAGYLCGQMFGLPILRHRMFETSFFWLQPSHIPHWGTVRNGRMLGSRARDVVTVPYGAGDTPGQRGNHGAHGGNVSMTGGLERGMRGQRTKGNGAQAPAANVGHAAGFEAAKVAMGIDWMRREELTQAIPPVMTEYIGRELLRSALWQGGSDDCLRDMKREELEALLRAMQRDSIRALERQEATDALLREVVAAVQAEIDLYKAVTIHNMPQYRVAAMRLSAIIGRPDVQPYKEGE